MLHDPVRVLVAAAVLVLALLSVQALEARFERADARNALHLVAAHDPGGPGGPLASRIARAHGVHRADLRWDARVTSSVFGHVRVTCAVSGPQGARYRFDVDLGRVAIHPADPATRALLAATGPGEPP